MLVFVELIINIICSSFNYVITAGRGCRDLCNHGNSNDFVHVLSIQTQDPKANNGCKPDVILDH